MLIKGNLALDETNIEVSARSEPPPLDLRQKKMKDPLSRIADFSHPCLYM